MFSPRPSHGSRHGPGNSVHGEPNVGLALRIADAEKLEFQECGRAVNRWIRCENAQGHYEPLRYCAPLRLLEVRAGMAQAERLSLARSGPLQCHAKEYDITSVWLRLREA